MKICLKPWLLCVLCAGLANSDIVSRFMQTQPTAKFKINANTKKKTTSKSSLDIEGFLNLSKKFGPQKSIKVVKTVPLDLNPRSEPVPTHQNNDLNLATVSRNRRLNLDNRFEIPDPSVLTKLQINIDNLSKSRYESKIDNDLFSTDLPPVVDNSLEVDLQKKISAMDESLQKLKIAKAKYLKSIEIEDQNRKLFTNAQQRINLDLITYRRRLVFMKNQAKVLKNEKDTQVLELENLINQRNIKQKQIRDLEKKNEIVNVQYSLINKQIKQITNSDTTTETEIAKLSMDDEKLKNELSQLEKEYSLLNANNQKLAKEFSDTLSHRTQLINELENLKTKIQSEEPVSQQLTQTSLELIQRNSDLEFQINKYENEIGTLHMQLKNLENMKSRAREHLGSFGAKKQEVLDLNLKIKTANQQFLKQQAELEKFERELAEKEGSCRCTKKQLMQIMTDKQMAANNQKTIAGLLNTVEATTPKPANMKLFNDLMFNNTSSATQPMLAFLNDPYFKQTSYFKSD